MVGFPFDPLNIIQTLLAGDLKTDSPSFSWKYPQTMVLHNFRGPQTLWWASFRWRFVSHQPLLKNSWPYESAPFDSGCFWVWLGIITFGGNTPLLNYNQGLITMGSTFWNRVRVCDFPCNLDVGQGVATLRVYPFPNNHESGSKILFKLMAVLQITLVHLHDCRTDRGV